MRIVFMGTPNAAVPALARVLEDGHEVAAVYSQPDRPSGRGQKILFSPIKEFALSHGLPVFQPIKIKTTETLTEFTLHQADALLVVAYGRILPESYLNAFPKGAINVHFSLLPKYRGAAPVNWAIVNGEARTGVTTMKMDVGLDTGNILLQRETEIGDWETSIELMDRLSLMGADLLSQTLADLDEISPLPQDDSRATFAPIMKREDGRIDWSLPAALISNRVRGFQPFPGSYTSHNKLKVTIWAAEPASLPLDGDVSAGTVVDAAGDRLIIACGQGTALSVGELQIEGKRRMLTRDVLNGTAIKAGDVLGVD